MYTKEQVQEFIKHLEEKGFKVIPVAEWQKLTDKAINHNIACACGFNENAIKSFLEDEE